MKALNKWRQHFRPDGIPKVSYATLTEARRSKQSDPHAVPYRCSWCKQWHVGADRRTIQSGLGNRVNKALANENLQQPSQRRKYIIRVAKKAEHLRNGTSYEQIGA